MHPVRLQRVELAVEQGAAVEVDQALGPLVDEMAEARSLAGGKNDRLRPSALRLAHYATFSVSFSPSG
jgi:hypothetical protein